MAKITSDAVGIWYWEYELKIWDDIDDREEIRSGVVTAETISEAMIELETYYGSNIMAVLALKPIIDGTVFDFQSAKDDTDFSYEVNKIKS